MVLEVHLPVDALNDEHLASALVDDALDDHVLRTDDVLLVAIFLDQFDERLAELAGLVGTDAGDILHFVERDRILDRHILERRVLKNHERRQLHLPGHLLAEVLQHSVQLFVGHAALSGRAATRYRRRPRPRTRGRPRSSPSADDGRTPPPPH